MSNNDLISGDVFLAGGVEEEIVASTNSTASEDDDDDDLSDDDDDVEVEAMDDDDNDNKANGGLGGLLGSDGVIAQLIDIREPLSNLRLALERRLRVNLNGYDFWLQDSQLLPENTTLVEQCVQGEGLVQINVEIKSEDGGAKKINIIDVLKPAEDAGNDEDNGESPETLQQQPQQQVTTKKGGSRRVLPHPPSSSKRKESVSSSPAGGTAAAAAAAAGQETVTRWVVCAAFRKEQERLNIPSDPVKWSRGHVQHWIKWTIGEFPKAAISMGDWDMGGKELCAMSHEDFKKKVPIDPSDLMWTHLELLRKCKFVAVVQKGQGQQGQSRSGGGQQNNQPALPPPPPRKTNKKPPVRLGAAKFTVMSESALGNRTGNNGQVQLWQFLLELLTEKEHRDVIHWIGEEGEFKLENPEVVAQLWGTRKNKPSMNYEKLSRALRYYYDGDMISKVHGKRFVYKFVCDLKQLIGYSAAELNSLVIEAEQKAMGKKFV